MIANKIKPKIQKVIDKFPTYVDIYRDAKNEFGETAMMLARNDETRKVIMEAVKERNKKTNGNVIVKGMER